MSETTTSHGFPIMGTDEFVTVITRDAFRDSDLYEQMMDNCRANLATDDNSVLLRQVDFSFYRTLKAYLEDAKGTDDIVVYAQETIPSFLFHAWALSDRYAEITGDETVFADAFFDVYTNDGIDLVGGLLHFLLIVDARSKGTSDDDAAEKLIAAIDEFLENQRNEAQQH